MVKVKFIYIDQGAAQPKHQKYQLTNTLRHIKHKIIK